ncbi:HMG box-containing protein [Gracilariopsis chorda]|uniref:HMG box-containing protein n=1 Tax=Gracilariopsis chorda TaxID=448386 RepID=A0A2V3IM37_9FLOR|nr:HMG box-containing protein [Gracilariopsis chorda]|eukprot:PXF43152.1 HMG box-containing protein [Gracilariopsis chorda]
MTTSPAFSPSPPLSPSLQVRREQVLHIAEKRGWLVAPRASQVLDACHAAWKAGTLPEVSPIPSPSSASSSDAHSQHLASLTPTLSSSSNHYSPGSDQIDQLCENLSDLRVQGEPRSPLFFSPPLSENSMCANRKFPSARRNSPSKDLFTSYRDTQDGRNLQGIEDEAIVCEPSPACLKRSSEWLLPGPFLKTRERCAEKLLQILDHEVLNGALTREKGNSVSGVTLAWNSRLYKTAGVTYMKKKASTGERKAAIELSMKVVDEPVRLYNTLAHEMCHAATWIIDNCAKPPHGSVFKSWAKRFHEWDSSLKITTCHDYAIRYKYNYQCVKCTTTYGRHSKSIDTTKKVCGRCRGTLQLLV